MQPTILLIRHGNTPMDDRVDATLDPPLTFEGVERIKRTAKFIKESGYKFTRILSSPVQRAMKAAEIIADGAKKVTPHPGALPWNLGDLQGRVTQDIEKDIERLQDYPDLKAPHGESYRHFHERWEAFLERVASFAESQPDEVVVVVTHSRNINDANAIIDDRPVGDIEEGTPEGSITLLAKNGDWSHKIIWEGR